MRNILAEPNKSGKEMRMKGIKIKTKIEEGLSKKLEEFEHCGRGFCLRCLLQALTTKTNGLMNRLQ